MSFGVFINFDGNCREAVTFYSQVFEQPLPYFLTFGEGDPSSVDSSVQMDKGSADKIMYTSLNIAGADIGFSDMPDNFEFVRGNSIGLSVTYPDALQAHTVLERLAKEGTLLVALTEVATGEFYSMVADPFDIVWTVRVDESLGEE